MWVRVTDVTRDGARVGLLGGTFDPIHVGHLVAASEVCAQLGLDQVLLVPTHRQPFKEHFDSAPPEHRLAMCELAVQDDSRLAVSAVDIERGGITYTVDTLRDIARERPEVQLHFIAGVDTLVRLDEWKDSSVLRDLAQFVAVTRAGHGSPLLDPSIAVVEIPQIGVSSTDVRRRIRTGAPVRYLIPHAVADYISTHQLYVGGFDD